MIPYYLLMVFIHCNQNREIQFVWTFHFSEVKNCRRIQSVNRVELSKIIKLYINAYSRADWWAYEWLVMVNRKLSTDRVCVCVCVCVCVWVCVCVCVRVSEWERERECVWVSRENLVNPWHTCCSKPVWLFFFMLQKKL